MEPTTIDTVRSAADRSWRHGGPIAPCYAPPPFSAMDGLGDTARDGPAEIREQSSQPAGQRRSRAVAGPGRAGSRCTASSTGRSSAQWSRRSSSQFGRVGTTLWPVSLSTIFVVAALGILLARQPRLRQCCVADDRPASREPEHGRVRRRPLTADIDVPGSRRPRSSRRCLCRGARPAFARPDRCVVVAGAFRPSRGKEDYPWEPRDAHHRLRAAQGLCGGCQATRRTWAAEAGTTETIYFAAACVLRAGRWSRGLRSGGVWESDLGGSSAAVGGAGACGASGFFEHGAAHRKFPAADRNPLQAPDDPLNGYGQRGPFSRGFSTLSGAAYKQGPRR